MSKNLTAPEPTPLLDRIAAALGCSPEVFYGQHPDELAETLELLTLWMATKDRPTRMRALMILRAGSGTTSEPDDGLPRAPDGSSNAVP